MLTVVVLGGSTFMGRELVRELSQILHTEMSTYVINRGNVYWSQEAPLPPASSSLHYLRVSDRNNEVAMATAFAEIPSPIDALVDFSGIHRRDVEVSVKTLLAKKGRMAPHFLYIYISTDSIYDAAMESSRTEEDTSSSSTSSTSSSDYLDCSSSDYGSNKKECDEYIQSFRTTFRHLILRLPDVIGPYDDTARFWSTLLWANSGVPMQLVASEACKVCSFVFSRDVVAFLLRSILRSAQECVPSAVFDMCCLESVPLVDFIKLVVSSSTNHNEKPIDVIVTPTAKELRFAKGCDYYPSVSFGFITCSCEALTPPYGFQPTPLRDAVSITSEFFAGARSRSEYLHAIRKLPAEVAYAVLIPPCVHVMSVNGRAGPFTRKEFVNAVMEGGKDDVVKVVVRDDVSEAGERTLFV